MKMSANACRACETNDDVVRLVEQNPNLTRVNLSNKPHINKVYPLGDLLHVTYVNISSTGVEFCPITLTKCRSLHRLDVSNTKVHTTTLAAIIAATNVTEETLTCEDCPNVNKKLLRILVDRGYWTKIKTMMSYAEELVAANIPRGPPVYDGNLKKYINNDVGPFWAKDVPVPDDIMARLRKEGCVCTGFVNLLMRKATIPLWHIRVPVDAPFRPFGLSGTDEWLYWWQRRVERFRPEDRSYEKGTLLLRCWNPTDQGHVAMLVDDAGKVPFERQIAHTLGIIKNETLQEALDRMQADTNFDLSKTPYVPHWGRQFAVYFGTEHNGFTHVLRPQHWCVLAPGSLLTSVPTATSCLSIRL